MTEHNEAVNFDDSLVTEHEIVKAADTWLHPLEPYGPTKALREMTRRIMLFDNGKIKMTSGEAAHLAQVSASAWLNPFTGEIWGWVREYRGERQLTIMPGRRGLLRHAHEQARERDTHFWPEYRKLTDPDERTDYLIEDGDLAFECRLRDSQQIDAWTRAVETASNAGYEPREIKREVGPMPSTFGLGVLTKREIGQLDSSGQNKMTHVERCQKRAYMMALKQLFNLPLAGSMGGGGETIDDYVLDVEWRELDQPPIENGGDEPTEPVDPPVPPAQPPPTEGATRNENQYETGIVSTLIDLQLCDNEYQAIQRLNRSVLFKVPFGELTKRVAIGWMCAYLDFHEDDPKQPTDDKVAMADDYWKSDPETLLGRADKLIPPEE